MRNMVKMYMKLSNEVPVCHLVAIAGTNISLP